MATIEISQEVYDALSNWSDEFSGTLDPGEMLPNGRVEIAVADDTLFHLGRIDNDPDQAIRRLLGLAAPVS
jgi:hypothetical protein